MAQLIETECKYAKYIKKQAVEAEVRGYELHLIIKSPFNRELLW